MHWLYAVQRAWRYAALNSGISSQRMSVLPSIPIERAASSTLRWVRSAMIASSFFLANFAP